MPVQFIQIPLEDNKRIALYAIISCLLWSTVFAGIKVGLKYTSPLAFAGTRFFISGLLILPFAGHFNSYLKAVKRHIKILFTLSLSQVLINYTMFYIGMSLVPAAVGAVVIGSQPFIIAILASFMMNNEPFTLRRLITLIAGISGVFLVSFGRQKLGIGESVELVGVLLLFGANITSGISNVIVAKQVRKINPAILSSFSLMSGGGALFLLSIPIEGLTPLDQPAEYWISLSWLSLLSAVTFTLWYRALHIPGVKVSDLNLWKFVVPVLGAILSWIIIPEESPEWLTVSGMIIIALSLAIFFYRKPD